MTTEEVLDALVARLGMFTYDFANEDALQRLTARVLDVAANGRYVREHAFPDPRHRGRRLRPDFWFPRSGIVAELKARDGGGTPAQVADQLARYAEIPDVRGILLLTGSARLAAGLPSTILGKPLRVLVVRQRLAA